MPIGARYQPKGRFRGILVQKNQNEYVFIGERIQTFKLPQGESVIKYVSPVTDKEVSMPYIIGKQNVYFLDNRSIPYFPKKLFELKLDAYMQQEQHKDSKQCLLTLQKRSVKRSKNISDFRKPYAQKRGHH